MLPVRFDARFVCTRFRFDSMQSVFMFKLGIHLRTWLNINAKSYKTYTDFKDKLRTAIPQCVDWSIYMMSGLKIEQWKFSMVGFTFVSEKLNENSEMTVNQTKISPTSQRSQEKIIYQPRNNEVCHPRILILPTILFPSLVCEIRIDLGLG